MGYSAQSSDDDILLYFEESMKMKYGEPNCSDIDYLKEIDDALDIDVTQSLRQIKGWKLLDNTLAILGEDSMGICCVYYINEEYVYNVVKSNKLK